MQKMREGDEMSLGELLHMSSEIDRLEAERNALQSKVTDLEAKVKAYEAALEFYANPDNWVTNSGKIMVTPIWTDDHENVSSPIQVNRYAGGKRARQALKEQAGEDQSDE